MSVAGLRLRVAVGCRLRSTVQRYATSVYFDHVARGVAGCTHITAIRRSPVREKSPPSLMPEAHVPSHFAASKSSTFIQ